MPDRRQQLEYLVEHGLPLERLRIGVPEGCWCWRQYPVRRHDLLTRALGARDDAYAVHVLGRHQLVGYVPLRTHKFKYRHACTPVCAAELLGRNLPAPGRCCTARTTGRAL